MKEKKDMIFLYKVTAQPASSHTILFTPGQVGIGHWYSHMWKMSISRTASCGHVWAVEKQPGTGTVYTLRRSAHNRLCRQKQKCDAWVWAEIFHEHPGVINESGATLIPRCRATWESVKWALEFDSISSCTDWWEKTSQRQRKTQAGPSSILRSPVTESHAHGKNKPPNTRDNWQVEELGIMWISA